MSIGREYVRTMTNNGLINEMANIVFPKTFEYSFSKNTFTKKIKIVDIMLPYPLN
ncbi:hypothetical protein [Candidatus Nitrosocosmicus franklandus]|uniref:Uncharacterized protein n=1 Tax=Candidatus Nitrosocosmicus franklandianus TaxID=1798806 RepID=A0A484I7D4_9ARCH|nr:hypothetical protein [Candidatus Nitrosocosmicus franklandus]VFJ13649.1 protein of unknown function [Candidatus Nitrosocosmicus franklandus]